MNALRSPLVLAVLATFATACSDGTTGRVDLRVSSQAMMPGSASVTQPQLSTNGSGQATIALGGDQIVIDQVEIVLRQVRFEGVGSSECEDAASGPEAASGPGECGEFRAGPTLLDLPLGAGVVQTFSATVPAGAYSAIQAQIHRPTDDNGDAAFLAEHPDFDGVSIRVTGTYLKAGDAVPVPFTYTTDLTSVLNIELDQPIDVAAGATLDVTLNIDLSTWFADTSAGRLVDPALALDGQPLEALVEQNIRTSFHAFEDANGDGETD